MLRPLLFLPPRGRPPRSTSTTLVTRALHHDKHNNNNRLYLLGPALASHAAARVQARPLPSSLLLPPLLLGRNGMSPSSFPSGTRAFSMPGAGGNSWVSPEAVPKGETLKKYSRNLTKEAMDGKLDPVS